MKKLTQDGHSPSPLSEPSGSTMNCDAVLDALDAYLDADLSPTRNAAVELHVRACSACRDELAWARQVRDGLRRLPSLTCPPAVYEARQPLAEVVPLESRRPSAAIPASPSEGAVSRAAERRMSVWRPLLAAAVAVVAVGLALLSGLDRPVPVDHTPVERTPVERTPVERTPVDGAPVETATLERTPAEGSPLQGTPIQRTPTEAAPADIAAAAPLDSEARTAPVFATEAGPDAQELARAEEEMRFALAYVNGIHRQAALALRDQMREHVAAAPYRGLQRLSLIDAPTS